MGTKEHHIVLHDELEDFLTELVRSGQYGNEKEVFESALSLLKAQEEQDLPGDVEELRAELDVGIAQFERGERAAFTAEDIIREGRAKLGAQDTKRSS